MKKTATKKRAFITGLTGQDGSYLAEFLLTKGYEVFGLVRRSSRNPFVRILPETLKQIHVIYGNLRDVSVLERALAEAKPDEIYNLAAQSDVGISFMCPEETFEIDYLGVGRLFNAARKICPDARLYQASTSEMYGKTPPPQNEKTLFQPVSPYGEAKLKAHEDFVVGYREKHDMFVSSGILFNHESPRRGEHFVTRKISQALARIKLGLQDVLEIGNLEAKRDWGFAGDYVEAMWLMLQQKKPDDFVVATGESHTVREFVVEAAKVADMPIRYEGKGLKEVGKDEKGRIILRINPKYYRPQEVHYLLGDSGKARKTLGWKPRVTFKGLVKMMVASDLEEQKRCGKR